MTIADVVNIFLKDNTVFSIYQRDGKPAQDISGAEEVDRFTWERKAAAGKWELLPLVKIYLV
jgi:hypothetical protein